MKDDDQLLGVNIHELAAKAHGLAIELVPRAGCNAWRRSDLWLTHMRFRGIRAGRMANFAKLWKTLP